MSSQGLRGARKPEGARWFSRWLRARREGLGLDRRRAAFAGRKSSRPLTVTLLADLEIGDRFPSLAVLPALANALRVPAWTLAERVHIAPLVEPAFVDNLDGAAHDRWLDRARAALSIDDHATAAAAADLASQTARRNDDRYAALLTLASALTSLGFPALATHAATSVYQQSSALTERTDALLALAEASLADGNAALATVWLSMADEQPLLSLPLTVQMRRGLVRAEIDLATGALGRAQAEFARLASEFDAADERFRRRTLRGLSEVLRRSGRPRDAERWERLTKIASTPAPTSTGAETCTLSFPALLPSRCLPPREMPQ